MAAPESTTREKRALAIFVGGATFSNAESFMQATAVPFVLHELTDSNAWVGAAAFAALFCSMLIGPVAGIAIDRLLLHPRRITAAATSVGWFAQYLRAVRYVRERPDIGGWLGDVVGLRLVIATYGVVLLALAGVASRPLRFVLLDTSTALPTRAAPLPTSPA